MLTLFNVGLSESDMTEPLVVTAGQTVPTVFQTTATGVQKVSQMWPKLATKSGPKGFAEVATWHSEGDKVKL